MNRTDFFAEPPTEAALGNPHRPVRSTRYRLIARRASLAFAVLSLAACSDGPSGGEPSVGAASTLCVDADGDGQGVDGLDRLCSIDDNLSPLVTRTADETVMASVYLPGFDDPVVLEVEARDDELVYQSDMLLVPARPVCDEEGRCAAGASVTSARLWPGGTIPYVIDAGHPMRSTIEEAAQLINDRTNLSLFERTDESHFVRIRSGEGCRAYVGRLHDYQLSRQTVTLGSGCGFRAAVHELLHVAGVVHEQSRSDRDDYIEIHFDNIVDDKEHNFRKLDTDGWWFTDLGVDGMNVGAYDYDSIMHYPSFTGDVNFAIDTALPILSRIDGGTIPRTRTMSAGDIATVNALYRRETTPPSRSYNPDPRVTYVLESRLAHDVVLDVAGAATHNGTNIAAVPYNNTRAQVFKFRRAPSGNYRLQSGLDSRKVVDVTGARTTERTNIQLWQANGTLAQEFRIVPVDEIYFELESALDPRKVLAVNLADGTRNVELRSRAGTSAGHFKLVRMGVPRPNEAYALESRLRKDFLVSLDSTAGLPGTNVRMQSYNARAGSLHQFVQFHEGEDCTLIFFSCDRYFKIESLTDAGAMIVGTGASSGQNVALAANSGGTSQRWALAKKGAAYFEFASHLGRVMDVTGAGTAEHTNVQLWGRNNTSAQKFKILETSR